MPPTPHRVYRISLKAKGTDDYTLEAKYVDQVYSYWTAVADGDAISEKMEISNKNWNSMSFDVDTKTQTLGLKIIVGVEGEKEGFYYVDDLAVLDVTELYAIKENCADNPSVVNVVDKALNDENLKEKTLYSLSLVNANLDNHEDALENLKTFYQTFFL